MALFASPKYGVDTVVAVMMVWDVAFCVAGVICRQCRPKKDRGERIDSEVRTPSIWARSLFWFRRLGRISAAVRARFALVDRQLGHVW